MPNRNNIIKFLMQFIAFSILSLVVALLTYLSNSSPSLAVILFFILISIFSIVFILLAPEPSEKFEKTAFLLLLLYTALLVLWPRYVLLRIPGLFGMSPSRMALTFLLLIWLYLILRSTPFRIRLNYLLKTAKPVLYSIFILIALKLLGLFVTDNFYISFKGILNEILTVYILFPIALTLINTEQRALSFIGVLISCAIITALLGVYENSIGHNLFLGHMEVDSEYVDQILMDKMRGGAYRIQSTFSHPLTFSEFLAMVGPFIVMIGFTPNRRFSKILLMILILPLLSYVILKSGSRSGVVVFAFSIVTMIFFILYRNSKISKNAASSALNLVVVILLLVAVAIFGYAMSDFIIGRTLSEERSGYARIAMWSSGLHLASQALIGYGQDMAAQILGYRGGNSLTIDSYYLSLLLDSGIFALLIYMFMLGYIVVRTAIYGVSNPEISANIAIAICASIISFSAIKMILSLPHNHGLIFMQIGIAFQLFLWQKVAKVDLFNIKKNDSIFQSLNSKLD